MINARVERAITINVGTDTIGATLVAPDDVREVVIFAHGSGSSRFSPRNKFVAERLHERRLGTLLVDLLTTSEAQIDESTAEFRFDIPLLARRLIAATDWCGEHLPSRCLAYFGASTGAAAALIAAADRPHAVEAVVSRGGRPDLAGTALTSVRAPTLLIVGEQDPVVIDLNRQAAESIRSHTELHIVPGATHLFEEPGALEEVARLAGDWFVRYLPPPNQRPSRIGSI